MYPPKKRWLALMLAGTQLLACTRGKILEPHPFETEIAAIEAQGKQPLSAEAVLFIGSSSIRLWDLKKTFPGLETVNHGFGGSEMAHLNNCAARIVFPFKPRRIVVYEGSNDIHAGRTPSQVVEEMKKFLNLTRDNLPGSKVYFLAVKPSLSRIGDLGEVLEANRLLKAICEQSAGLAVYVDGCTALLGANGMPDPALYQQDLEHLNELGYARWVSLLEPLVMPTNVN